MRPSNASTSSLLEEISDRLESIQKNAWGDYDNYPEYKKHDVDALTQLKNSLQVHAPRCNSRGQIRNLHIAAAMDLPQTALYLLKIGVPLNSPDSCGYTPLILAASKNAFMIVGELLKYGADIKHRADEEGVMALHMTGGAESTQLLLAAGADPNSLDFGKNTPLHWVAGTPDDNALLSAQLLLEAGAKVNAINKAGETPLFRATWTDVNPEMVRLLIAAGADINHTTPSRDTPLWAAVYSANPAVIKILLEHGADPNVRQEKGISPLQFAMEQSMPEEIIQTLAAYGAQV